MRQNINDEIKELLKADSETACAVLKEKFDMLPSIIDEYDGEDWWERGEEICREKIKDNSDFFTGYIHASEDESVVGFVKKMIDDYCEWRDDFYEPYGRVIPEKRGEHRAWKLISDYFFTISNDCEFRINYILNQRKIAEEKELMENDPIKYLILKVQNLQKTIDEQTEMMEDMSDTVVYLKETIESMSSEIDEFAEISDDENDFSDEDFDEDFDEDSDEDSDDDFDD